MWESVPVMMESIREYFWLHIKGLTLRLNSDWHGNWPGKLRCRSSYLGAAVGLRQGRREIFQLTLYNCGAAVDDLFYCGIFYCGATVNESSTAASSTAELLR